MRKLLALLATVALALAAAVALSGAPAAADASPTVTPSVTPSVTVTASPTSSTSSTSASSTSASSTTTTAPVTEPCPLVVGSLVPICATAARGWYIDLHGVPHYLHKGPNARGGVAGDYPGMWFKGDRLDA